MGGDGENSSARDGAIDFSGYSLGQLHDLRGLLDRQAFPQNYANLLAEIERRGTTADPAAAAEQPAQALSQPPPAIGRFSRHDGWRGWAQALRRRSPLFGAGVLEIGTDEIRLSGTRRTWLGVTAPGEYLAPLACVRNAALDGAALRFEIKRRFRPARTVSFDTGSSTQAREMHQRLPGRQSAGFEKRWREARDFHDRLKELGGHHWVTPALVLVNLLVFVATLIASKGPVPDPSRFLDWGANFGPLTTTGQWWRILSSMFLHGSWAHVLLNMWVLWNVGRLAERLYGSTTFAFLYFATGICGALSRTVWDPSIVSIGASGAVFGVLGALLAMLLHRGSRIPRSVALAHWPSTLFFLLFNLVGGYFDPLIDNAAHVGGLLSGVLFGWVLVRPVDAAARRGFPAHQLASTALIALLLAAGCFAHLRTAGGQVSISESYLLARPWYPRGETESLQLWAQVMMRASAGTISSEEFADTFADSIVPFWKTTQQRLEREAPRVPKAQQPFDKMLREFVRLRLAWAEALRDTARGHEERAAETPKLAADTNKALAALHRFNMRAAADQRPRALANSWPVVKIRNLLSVGSGECVKPPERSGNLPAFSDAPGDGPKMRSKAGCQAQRFFVNGDYQALEDLIRKSAAATGDLRDGGSTLSGIFNGLDDYFSHGSHELEQLLGRTSDWRRSVRDAAGAELTEVLLLREWAWSARGTGYAGTVSRQGWEAFALRVEMAAVGLREIRARASGNPYWYQLALQIGLDQQSGAEELDGIFAEGTHRFPNYLSLYSARMQPLMPRWGGSVGEVDAFIQSVADSHRGTLEPDEWYAELYSIYSGMERDDINIFAAGNADWARVRDGFDRLRRRYPRSDYIVNQYAKLACAAADADKYRALRPVVGARTSSLAWSEKRSLDSCDKWFASENKQP
jgi:rhomboid protease GluP